MSVETAALNNLISKTMGVCGGDACICGSRIPVWTLIEFRRAGANDAELIQNFPSLDATALKAAWKYAEENKDEIERAINENSLDGHG